MGLICGSFSLSNPTRPDLAPLVVSALADSEAVHLCIPENLAIQLNLAELERREVVLVDGHRRTVPYVGPWRCASATTAASPAPWCWATRCCSAPSR